MAKGYVGIPTSYTPIEYIESTGTQYIDTGIVPTSTIKLEFDANIVSGGSNVWMPVFGSRSFNSSNNVLATYFCLYIQTSSYYLSPNYAGFDPGTGGNTKINFNQRYKLTEDKGQFYIDDVLQSGISTTNTLTTGDKTIYLFTNNALGDVQLRGQDVKLYGCKIWDNNILVRDFIPILDYNNVACLYETVEGKFYYNQGAGSFNYSYLNTDEYDVLDYIQSNGTQFINTGIAPQDSTCIEAKFQATAGGSMGYLAGTYQDGASANRYYVCGTTGSYFTFNVGNDAWRQVANQNTNVNHFIYNNSNKKLVWNGSEISYAPPTFGNANTKPIGLLSVYPQESNKYKAKLFFVKIYNRNTNEMLRWFIPVIDKSDNKACLYDMVSKQFFKDVNQNDFIAGNVVGITGQPVSIGSRAREITKAYVGIPTSYTPVEYIESSGTQYIDTGYSANSNTKLELKLQFTSASHQEFIFCDRDFNNGTIINAFSLFRNTSNQFRVDYSSVGTLFSHTVTANNDYTYVMDKNELYENNVLIKTETSASFSATNKLRLFSAFNLDSTANNFFEGKVFYCKIWDNDTLVRDFIPVKDQDNIACLYEQVEGKLYYNQGTGTFTAGSTTGQTVSLGNRARKIKKGYVGVNGVARQIFPSYTLLNYIESSGAQWIDTGVVYDYATTRFDIDFQYLSSDNDGYISVSWSGSNHDAYLLGSSGTSSIVCGTAQSGSWTSIKTKDANRHKYTYNNASHQIIYDGSVISGKTTVNVNGVVTMRIFRSSGTSNFAKARIYGYKISNIVTQELIRDFIPVLDPDGVPCLFDKVTGTYFYNQGTGTFLYG